MGVIDTESLDGSRLIDQLGGWSTQSVGQGYGDGYSLNQTSCWLLKTLSKHAV